MIRPLWQSLRSSGCDYDPGCLPACFRASDIIELEWSDIDFNAAEMHVETKSEAGRRGMDPRRPATALRRLHKEQDPKLAFVFVSERGAPFTRDSFNWMVKRAGKKADLPFQVHAHMLRH